MTERTPGRPSNAVSSHQKHPPAKIAVARSPGGRALDAKDIASQNATQAATRNFKTSLLLRFETTPPRHIRFQNQYGGFTPGGWVASGSLSGRFFLSRPRPHDELARGVDLDGVQLVEALRPGGSLQFLEGAGHSRRRDHALGRPQSVAGQGVSKLAPEEETGDPESRRLRGSDVLGSPGHERVGVVQDEGLPRRQTRGDQQPLPVPGPQHVAADTHMGLEEAFLVEGRLARPLDADEEHRFHPGRHSPISRGSSSRLMQMDLARDGAAPSNRL